jgi:biopolymer transport protein ExbD
VCPSSFRRDHLVRIGNDAVTLAALPERIKQALLGQRQQNVMLAGDGVITLQELITVASQLQQAACAALPFKFQPPAAR